MKRIRCSKCDGPVTFSDELCRPGATLIFECPHCGKQFKIHIPSSRERARKEAEAQPPCGELTVVENAFHFRQTIPLYPGDNVLGRFVRGTKANAPIRTVDPSVDTTHCIVTASEGKDGQTRFELRDAGSSVGTFCQDHILAARERLRISDGEIITLGATTLILHVPAQ